MDPQAILEFWFEQCEPSQWFKKDDTFDLLIKQRFSNIHAQACAGELSLWRNNLLGRLAEIVILDQFSRNIFRDTAQAFSADSLALCLCQHALELDLRAELSQSQIDFLLMPIMHSESLWIHEHYDRRFKSLVSENVYSFELKHRVIIERFGRYPHRNVILSRSSTVEELAFLKQGNSSF